MKIKKIIMLILMFMISLSLFSVVRAETVKVSNEYVEVVQRRFIIWKWENRWRNVEVTIPAEYFNNKDNIVIGEANEILFKDTGRTLEFQTYFHDGKKGISVNLDIGEINSDGSLNVKVSWREDLDQATELEINEGKIDENGNAVKHEKICKYVIGSGTPDNPVPVDKNEGNGTQLSPDDSPGGLDNPYKINVSNIRDVVEIKYDKVPFYFYVDRNSEDGTFLVDWDEEEKVVTFDYISPIKKVGYVKEHENSKPYIQVGATSVNLVKEAGTYTEVIPKYKIKEVSNSLENNTKDGVQDLKCAFNHTSEGIPTLEQHSASYVFVCRTTQKPDGPDAVERDVIYEFCGYEEPDEVAGILERLCTRILAFLGDLFMLLIKTFLGSDVTIDKIIFNEYEPVVIDLEGGRGILGDSSVRTIIQSMYTLFLTIAVAVYATILLYIGVKVLFGVGTPRQEEYRKDLTNWIVGLVLLFAVPQFLRYIPALVNGVIEYIGGNNRIIMYSYYNMDIEMDSEKIGVSGEDNRSVYIEVLKGLREEKEGQLASASAKRKELEKATALLNNTNYQQAVVTIKQTIEGLGQEYSGKSQKIIRLINIEISKGITDGKKIAEKALVASGSTSSSKLPSTPSLPMSSNPLLPTNNPKLLLDSEKLASVLMSTGYIEMMKPFLEAGEEILELANQEETLKEEIKKLTSLIEAPDLMGDMRVLAGKTGRFTYAVVWLICIYEMIVMLCMYYRRVIVMGILITIYPLVAMTYSVDKLKDGKAQTLTNWYKEFTVNLVVQIVHAVVYIILIQSGIRLYQANSNNWLFFLLSVLFLFPAERLMRGIFGLKGTSIKELKANAVGIAGATATAVTLGKQVGRAASEKAGVTKRGKAAKADKQKAEAKAKANRDNKDKYLQTRADTKERLRKQKAAQRRAKAASMRGTRKMAYNAYAKTMNAAGRARSAAYKLGNKGRKLKGHYRNLQDSKFAKYAKGTWKVARGATGLATGAATFVTTSGTSGLGAGLVAGKATAQAVGGFKDRDRLQQAVNNRASVQNTTAAQRTNGGSSGGQAGGRTPRTNIPPSVSGVQGTGNGNANTSSGNTNVNVNTSTTQNVNTQDSN